MLLSSDSFWGKAGRKRGRAQVFRDSLAPSLTHSLDRSCLARSTEWVCATHKYMLALPDPALRPASKLCLRMYTGASALGASLHLTSMTGIRMQGGRDLMTAVNGMPSHAPPSRALRDRDNAKMETQCQNGDDASVRPSPAWTKAFDLVLMCLRLGPQREGETALVKPTY